MSAHIREHATRVTLSESPEERIAAIQAIVKEGQYAKVDGTMIDLFTAVAIMAVYNAIKRENQVKFASLKAGAMGLMAFKILNKVRAA